MAVFLISLDQRKVDSARVDKELAQLRKVTRKKDNQIKSLQSDARRRELVLKRRQEEVCIYKEYIDLPVCMHKFYAFHLLLCIWHYLYM